MKKPLILLTAMLMGVACLGQSMPNGAISVCRDYPSTLYKQYEYSSKRNQKIIDSLMDKGLIWMGGNYLQYEPYYMKEIKKTEQFYDVVGNEIRVFYYVLERKKGFRLIKEKTIK